jgi:hypothetical protein
LGEPIDRLFECSSSTAITIELPAFLKATGKEPESLVLGCGPG